MSVRRAKYKNRNGAEESHWIVDIVFQHADGRVERLKKVSPVQTQRGAERYEQQLRAKFLSAPMQAQALAIVQPSAASTEPKKEVPTFRAFVEDRWWPIYPVAAGNRHTTVREKESHLRVHLMPFFGRLRLDDIRREHFDKFIATLVRDKKLSAKRAKNVMATLRKIFASAWDWEVLPQLPRFPRIKVAESSFDFLTREESDKVIAVARNPEENALLMFAFHTGARAGEQLAFEWTDLDLHNRLVVIRRSSTNGIVGPTKNGKERKVPLTKTLELALKAIRHLKGPRVFCNPDGSPLTLWQLHDRLWGACRRSGIRKIRWHDCRHSFASQLVMAGTPIRQVQDWLGHSTITMTMRYSHLAPNVGREFIAMLDADANARDPRQSYGQTTDKRISGSGS